MSTIKLAGLVIAVVLLAAAAVTAARRGRAQSSEISTFEPQSMSDYQKPAAGELKKKLSSVQFAVTQQCGTEPAFNNAYWDNHRPGIYVDVVSGEPLFSSLDKFDSGCGWPSFSRPLSDQELVEHRDVSHGR